MSPRLQAQLGSVIAAGGVVWTIAIASQQLGVAGIVLPSGPLEVCAVGILIWLHGKWRGSVRRV
ncbi:MAG TPA: hypothetical protein VGQ94_01075 [Terriglobales bacterium]|nr:hypothetical protein [Terriglobales bacterium]